MSGGHIFYVCNLYQKIGQLANVGITFFFSGATAQIGPLHC